MFRRTRAAVWAGEALDALVADGVVGGDGFPGGAVPHFDAEGLDVLAVVEPLHGQRTIEGYGSGESDFEGRVVRTGWGGPEGVRIVVECEFQFGVGLGHMFGRQGCGCAVALGESGAESSSRYVGVGSRPRGRGQDRA